jgi:superfamily I DNA/RNA helicase
VSHEVRSDLLVALGGDVSSYLDGEIPDLDSLDATDKATLRELAKLFAYWRRQLRSGAVREVILDVGDQYAGWITQKPAKKLVDLCSRILSDLRGTLSARLLLVSRKDRDAEKAAIVLMTMHGAKGLEFETVHIVDASKTDDGSDVVRPEAERRLMYVALTRAKNCCVVWHSGEAHPTIAESQIVYQKTRDDLLALVKRAG